MSKLSVGRADAASLEFDPLLFRYDPRQMLTGIFSGVIAHIGSMPSDRALHRKIHAMRDEGALMVPQPYDRRITHIFVDVDSQIPQHRVQLLDEHYFSNKLTDIDLKSQKWIMHRHARLSEDSAPSPSLREEDKVVVLDYRWIDDCIAANRIIGEAQNYNGREIRGRYAVSAQVLPSPPFTLASPVQAIEVPAVKLASSGLNNAGLTANQQLVAKIASRVPRSGSFQPRIGLARDGNQQDASSAYNHPKVPSPSPSITSPFADVPPPYLADDEETSLPVPVVPIQELPAPVNALAMIPALPKRPKPVRTAGPSVSFATHEQIHHVPRHDDHWVPSASSTIPAKRAISPSRACSPRTAPRKRDAALDRPETPVNAAMPEIVTNDSVPSDALATSLTPHATSTEQYKETETDIKCPSDTTDTAALESIAPAAINNPQSEAEKPDSALDLFTSLGMPFSFHVLGTPAETRMPQKFIEMGGGVLSPLESATFIVVRQAPGSALTGDKAALCRNLGNARTAISYDWILDCMKDEKLLGIVKYKLSVQ